MRRYRALLVVVALAAISVVSAAAFNQAQVTSSATFTVKSTEAAKLALIPAAVGTGNRDNAAVVSAGGILTLSFGDLQPNSVYTWDNIFQVKNNTAEVLKFSVTGGAQMEFKATGGVWAASVTNADLAANGTKDISIRITVPSSGLALNSVNDSSIVVTATAQ